MTRAFTKDLSDPNSKAFKELARTVSATMDSVLAVQKIPAYVGVEVTGFEAGSTVAIVKVKFLPDSKPDAGSVVDKVESAVQGGQLDSLGIDKSKKITATLDERMIFYFYKLQAVQKNGQS